MVLKSVFQPFDLLQDLDERQIASHKLIPASCARQLDECLGR